ncbi:MAG: MgtC/SapB family protein [Rhodocyclaceae bacterium]|nr:MgtC/SapB family protein [Pseudomonadota bacterium]MDQ7972939.1 MgtC/SapB family protein [Rhodocyclaceae bacterium]MDQ7999123.1 MgtC/SapB family protein [Pseudomonadota bacterium]MDQ8019611.1 MgtC/SapB family protein [Pseudomonadota bacterium]
MAASSWWNEITEVVVAEFSDVPDLTQFVRISVRLLLASVLGFILGFEREQQGKAAGVRTHMLVAIGSAMFVLVPQQTGIEPADMSRVIQGLVAGVGFLCAGTILKHGAGEQQVQGLTTAAGLWMTAAIGMACGLGREATAVLSALLALAVLQLVPRLVSGIERIVGPPRDSDERPQPQVIAAPDDDRPKPPV